MEIIEPPKIIVQSLTINKYKYALGTVIPHTSVMYYIYCYSGDNLVKTIQGIIEGEQYKEWTTDEWLDAFIKQKVEEIPVTEVIEPAPEPVV